MGKYTKANFNNFKKAHYDLPIENVKQIADMLTSFCYDFEFDKEKV